MKKNCIMDLESLFKEFEGKKSRIPDVIKNILILMEYSKTTIGKMDEKDIIEIQESVPSLLEDLDIPIEERGKYLGLFIKNPSKFRFLPGQRATFVELVEFCSQRTFLNGVAPPSKKAKVDVCQITDNSKGIFFYLEFIHQRSKKLKIFHREICL